MYRRGFKSWCEKKSQKIRSDLGLENSDPVNPRIIAEYLDIEVWIPGQVPNISSNVLSILTRKQSSSWSAVTVNANNKTVVIVNSSHSAARQNSNLMHELSHILLQHEPVSFAVNSEGMMLVNTYNKTNEEEANWLAGSILLPRDALIKIFYSGMTARTAAIKYGVSIKMFQFRLNVTGVSKMKRR